MKKLMLLLVALVCVVSFSMSVYAAPYTLENTKVKFQIAEKGAANQGEIIYAAEKEGGVNLLDSLTLYVYYKNTSTGAQGAKRISQLEDMTIRSVSHDYYGYQPYTSTIEVSGRLIDHISVVARYGLSLDPSGKRYLDMRYTICSDSHVSDTGFAMYMVMDLPAASGVSVPVADRPGEYQLVNDEKSAWSDSSVTWPAPLQLVGGSKIVMGGFGVLDDYEAGNLADIESPISTAGKLGNGVFATNGNAGAGLRFPPSSAGTGLSPFAPDPYIEARVEVVPEPCTMGLMLAGLAGLGIRRRRRS